MGEVVNVVIVLARIKSYTNTSMSMKKGVDAGGWVECCCVYCSRICSKGCRGRGFPILINFTMTLQAVSMLEQKKGGISHQPICRLLGTTISM